MPSVDAPTPLAALALPARLTHQDAAASLRSLGAAISRHPAPDPVGVDAAALQQFDSSALAVLLALRRQALDSGRRFTVDGLTPRLRELASLYGVGELLQS